MIKRLLLTAAWKMLMRKYEAALDSHNCAECARKRELACIGYLMNVHAINPKVKFNG